MKIAMIGHKRIPSREGGVEVVVQSIALRMAALGHDVYVYNRHCGEDKIKEYKGVHIIEIPTFKHSSLNAMVYSLLATIHAIFHRYDVVHYHAEGPCVMLRFARWFGKKTVATIHGLNWKCSKWGGFASKYLLFGEKTAAKCAEALIVLSESAKRYFKETYGREGILIPNGVERGVRREPNLIQKFGISKGDYILFLARISREKGLDYLLDAFKELKTDKKLIVAGRIDPTTPYIESVKKKAEQDPRVQFVGFVQGELLEELYTNCYVYVLPSDVEGMPISVLEAVLYGARALVSGIEENHEILGDYGHTFEVGNYASLRDRLQYLLDNEDLHDCDFKADQTPEDVKAQAEAITKKYNWDHIVDETLDVYRNVIKGK